MPEAFFKNGGKKALIYVLYTIFFVSCILLVVTVLLQPGKTDAGALFTSNVSSAAFGPRGTASILAKITIVAATVFMVSAFVISMPAFQGGGSVLQTIGESDDTTSPVVLEGEEPVNTAQPEAVPPANAEEQVQETPASPPAPEGEQPDTTPETPANN